MSSPLNLTELLYAYERTVQLVAAEPGSLSRRSAIPKDRVRVSPEVIGANTLNFRPNFIFFCNYFFEGSHHCCGVRYVARVNP